MKEEVLLHHEATALAAKNGLAGLPELAAHLHLDKAIRRGDAVVNMTHSEEGTSATGFYFNPAAGEGAILTAHAGLSHEENALEGVRLSFGSHEIKQAQARFTELVRLHEPVDLVDRLFTVV